MRLAFCLLLLGSIATLHAEENLTGTWKLVGLVEGGKTATPKEVPPIVFIFTEKTLTCKERDQVVENASYVLKTDPKPATIIMTDLKKGHTKNVTGIYEFKDNTLRLALGAEGKPGPAAFDAKDVGVLYIFKREP